MTDDTNTIRLGLDSDKRALAALARVEARLAAPCHCDKCLDCLAADGYEAAIERAEQAERALAVIERERADAQKWGEELKERLAQTERDRDEYDALLGRKMAERDVARAEANRLREALRKIASYRGLDPLVASNIAHNAIAGPQTKEQT